MQGEFLGVHGRLDGVDKRLDGVDRRLTNLERGMDEMKESSSELFAKLDEFIFLYKDTKQEIALLARQVKRLEERILQLEVKK